MADHGRFARRPQEETPASMRSPTQPAGLPAPQIEKFTVAELTALRNELLRGSLDQWQAAEVAGNFLAGHGYGASADQLREAIVRMEGTRCSIECLQAELERVAYIQ